jgi:dihydrofolate reductase
MEVTLAVVMSLNGKLTRGDEPNVHAWSSVEDWRHFKRLLAEHDVIILDRNTYEVVKPEPEPTRLRLVLTHNPALYQEFAVPGQLEFRGGSPTTLIAQLQSEGYKKVLLAGGSQTTSDFLALGLVDDVYLTFEPLLFGSGRPLLSGKHLDVALRLQEIKQLNEQGTFLAHYKVQKTV